MNERERVAILGSKRKERDEKDRKKKERVVVDVGKK